MKITLTFLWITIICHISIAQSCDYNYGSSIILSPKDRIVNDDLNKEMLTDINTYQNCIRSTTDSLKLFWLNNKIAFDMSELGTTSDSIIKYGSKAFNYNKERLCKDYVKIYVYHERDSNFPMKRHYLDQTNFSQFEEIRSFCLENYKEAELEIYAEKERKESRVKASIKFNQEFLNELVRISDQDQKERKKSTINWTIQNRLDSLNRIKLDVLYEKFGFPSNDKVTKEGTMKAFMVLHHSTDCNWNKKWTRLFIERKNEITFDALSFFFYRNFNSSDGICKNNKEFLNELKTNESSKELLDFKSWERQFNKEK